MRLLMGLIVALAMYAGAIPHGSAFDLSDAASRIASGVGQVKVYPGDNGAPIFIFEERHDSYTMMLEESVSLIRLHKIYHLHDIGLEGFVKTDKPFVWPQAPSPDAALILLKKGEISSAEFMAIGYGVSVHPIEVSSEYVLPSGDLSKSVSEYVWLIAVADFEGEVKSRTLPADVVAKFLQLQKADDREGIQKLILDQDTFAGQIFGRLGSDAGANVRSTSADISFFEGIRDKARSLDVHVGVDSASELDKYISFLKARQAASATMAEEISKIASQDVLVVAMIIGAAHTSDVVAALTTDRRPVVVVSPLQAPVGGHEILFSAEQMKAIYNRQPIENDPLTLTLRDLVKVKPVPNFDTPWVAAKAEIYAKVDDLVKTFFGSGGDDAGGGQKPPLGGGGGGQKPPLGGWSGVAPDSPEFRGFLLAIPDDKLKGRRVQIDRSRIELVNTARGSSIVFPMQILGPNNQVQQEYWVRAGVTKGAHDVDSDHVEEDILDQLKEGKGPESVKTDIDEIDISKVAKMVVAPTRAEVLKKDVFMN